MRAGRGGAVWRVGVLKCMWHVCTSWRCVVGVVHWGRRDVVHMFGRWVRGRRGKGGGGAYVWDGGPGRRGCWWCVRGGGGSLPAADMQLSTGCLCSCCVCVCAACFRKLSLSRNLPCEGCRGIGTKSGKKYECQVCGRVAVAGNGRSSCSKQCQVCGRVAVAGNGRRRWPGSSRR